MAVGLLAGCRRARTPDPTTVVVAIESSPENLDLRVGTDAQSERIGGLIFDPLVHKDAHYQMQPWLAQRWEQPDARTWVFHLRDGVRFQDGRPLEAADVAWTLQSMRDGSLVTAKGGAFAHVQRVETPDRLTVVLYLDQPDETLLFSLSDGLFGVVPRGAGQDFGLHPVGSGPFRFVSAVADKDVLLERNPGYWAGAPRLPRVRFAVVPDAITTALELKKGSVDVESNAVPPDMFRVLRQDPALVTESAPGSRVEYLNFNVTDPLLRDVRVRQAIACAMDRRAILDSIWHGQATPASTLLPRGHWAAAEDSQLAQYPHDVARAEALLQAAGHPPDKSGVRIHLSLKISNDETTRLTAIVLQQQLRAAGIDLQIRSAEFGTFYADITRGSFQMYALRWIGSNEDPDIFRYAYASTSFPPRGGNRGRYANAAVDALLQQAAEEPGQEQRRRLYLGVQQDLAKDLPGIPFWYLNNAVVHRRRLQQVVPSPSGSFDFLRQAVLSADVPQRMY
ncbi:MAG: ABC transporter substrate-binding protein [Acidobacteriota bacterium]|nr:ABC transporter substrate-binding protein [Acidobacteriota bacterium]